MSVVGNTTVISFFEKIAFENLLCVLGRYFLITRECCLYVQVICSALFLMFIAVDILLQKGVVSQLAERLSAYCNQLLKRYVIYFLILEIYFRK